MPRRRLIELRAGTAAEWAATNPVLAAGEPGYVTDTHQLFIGDGITAVNALGSRAAFTSIDITETNPAHTPLKVHAAPAQAVSLVEYYDAAGAVLAAVTQAGKVTAQEVQAIGSAYASFVQASSGTGAYLALNGYGVSINQRDPTAQALFVAAAPAQTADIQAWANNAGSPLLTVGSDGHLGFIAGNYMTLGEGVNIHVGTATGTKIGMAANQKIGFYGQAPTAQQTGVAVTAAGIHAALVNLGLITA